jgi:hypothetical protein
MRMPHKSDAAMRLSVLLFVALLGAPALAQTETPLAMCGKITERSARLSCYDWANRSGAGTQDKTSPANRSLADDFGWRNSTSPLHNIRSGVQSYSFDRLGKFTVQLDNGQVWRQFDDDSGIAKFKDLGSNQIVITHGFWQSYNLRLNTLNTEFRVERVH